MELNRITLPPITAPGEVTTFYSFESGTARSVALSNMAVLLAGRQHATVPVLMIDWDTESPGLHHFFEQREEKLGLLEYFQACRDHLRLLAGTSGGDDEAMARHVLESIDWELYVERVDESRPLYLMRAGRFDDSYGERAHAMDWDSLFAACPALFRSFGDFMSSRFRHVLIDARSGRSAAVSICTALLPRKLVGLFTPNQRSLEGLAGVVNRAIDYRCSHEEAQRPLMVYPLPALVDSADCERRMQWRRGDPLRGSTGYQPVLERLLAQSYGLSQLSLDSYLDEVQLQQTAAMSGGAPLSHLRGHGVDRFSLERTFDTLLDWMEHDRFPWQSRSEIALLGTIAAARAQAGDALSGPALLPLARDLAELGDLYRANGREVQARECLEESLSIRQRMLGNDDPDTRAGCSKLARLLRDSGKLDDARELYAMLARDCQRLLGEEHPETLAARSGLASTLAQLGEFDEALALHAAITRICEDRFGNDHLLTLNSYAGQAQTLARQREFSRARMLFELVLDGRQRLLGNEHDDTLRCAQQLAIVLSDLGDMANAKKLQQGVVAARERHAGADHPSTVKAREILAEILAGLGDIPAVRALQEELARTRERNLGSEHPETLSIQLSLATTLGMQGELDAACVLQQRVVDTQERMYGADSPQTLHSKKMLAKTLSEQGHTLDARRLEDAVAHRADRQLAPRAMVSGPHESHRLLHYPAAGPQERDHASEQLMQSLNEKLEQLQQLIDSRSDGEARELADSLRKSVLRPSVAHPLRKRGVAMIRKVYTRDGDKDALLSFVQDEVALLDAHLNHAAGGRRVAAE
ncbi:tetratricopeptide repeat protein [Massilia soli]|uniref:Tetratricopeptide repeat protein n=1 Tax=Massilia soli TaxID=2792854 RepID=A0ABS7SR14_9BURK|nr:tetratricopeptide repeat protein [Massilia soli]MBZ2208387.1 tetratricopeptide repeat protein [Massilia soli]